MRWQILGLPGRLYRLAAFNLDWVWRFRLRGEELGQPQREYLVRWKLWLLCTATGLHRRNLGLSERQWSSLSPGERDHYLACRLWETESWAAWQRDRQEEERVRQVCCTLVATVREPSIKIA